MEVDDLVVAVTTEGVDFDKDECGGSAFVDDCDRLDEVKSTNEDTVVTELDTCTCTGPVDNGHSGNAEATTPLVGGKVDKGRVPGATTGSCV